MTTDPGRTGLYRLYDDAGQLLYVGISHDPATRWKDHSRIKTWWPSVHRHTVEWFADREAAAVAELTAIRTEDPVHNRAGRTAAQIALGGKAAPPIATSALAVELDEACEAHAKAEAVLSAARERLYELIRIAAVDRSRGGLGPSATARLSGFTREHVTNIRDGRTTRSARRSKAVRSSE